MSTLQVEPEPRSVAVARAWVRDRLADLDRRELVDTATLGVSELVTNAILHGRPPVLLRIAGTTAHPRIEVVDCSPTPPAVRDMTADERLMTTVGRGLGLVAMSSRTWGAELSPDGKVVWFEPAAQLHAQGTSEKVASADVFVVSDGVDDLDAATAVGGDAPDPDDRVDVHLLGLPVQLFAEFRGWYEELRRELRLLALAHGDDYPVAMELSQLSLQVARERRQASGVRILDEAIAGGEATVDLHYSVPASAPATMARVRELLRETDRFIAEHGLLMLDASPEQREMREWYLGEFVRQGEGLPPVPWAAG